MPTFSLFWTFLLFFLLLPVWAQLPSCLRPYGATILWGRWEGRPKSRPALHSYPDAAPPVLVSRWYLLSALFWLLSVSLTLWQCIRAQPQAPVGLISSCIRCHLMSSSPYSSQLYLPWCFFDVSSLISYQTAPAKVPAQGGSLGRLRCHGCYTLFSHCCRNHCLGRDWLRSLLCSQQVSYLLLATICLYLWPIYCALHVRYLSWDAELNPPFPWLLTFHHCVKSCLLRSWNIFYLVWKIKQTLLGSYLNPITRGFKLESV